MDAANGLKSFSQSMKETWFFKRTMPPSTLQLEIHKESPLVDLQFLRDQWKANYNECKVFAENLELDVTMLPKAKKKKNDNDLHTSKVDENCSKEETEFKRNAFYFILKSVICKMKWGFATVSDRNESCSFLWQFHDLKENELNAAVKNFAKKYTFIVSDNLFNAAIHLRHVYDVNFESRLTPYNILNAINARKLEILFWNICSGLRIFCTLTVSISSDERSFSALARIKNLAILIVRNRYETIEKHSVLKQSKMRNTLIEKTLVLQCS